MNPGKLFCLGLTLIALSASAQLATDPDWQESEAPAPPSFDPSRLLPIEMPGYVSLRFGIDPATLALTADGIVRYVVVASNSTGLVQAMYEGIRCATWEVKTYARSTWPGPWRSPKEPQWQGLSDNKMPSKHALALAQQGLCEGRSASAASAAVIVDALRNPNLSR